MQEQHVTLTLALSELPNGRGRARIVESPIGASRGTGEDFDIPAEPENSYALFLKEVDSGNRAAEELVTLGRNLYESVFTGRNADGLAAAKARCLTHDAYLRIAICAQSPRLSAVPWEFLHDGAGYLLQQGKVHLVRVLDELPPQMAPFRPFRTMMIVVANPSGFDRFDSDAHLDEIQRELDSMGAHTIVISPATRALLMKRIDAEDFDAFYFLGHGRLNDDGEGEIYLEDKDGKGDPLPASTLAQWLRPKQPFYIAYFNSCDTGKSDDQNTFAGVAQRVLADGFIPAVVGQQAPVLAKQSMDIAEVFLRRVRRGSSPESAIAQARSAAKNIAWGIPVLYTHVRGPEEFERNRIECLLNADQNATFALSLATLCMGVPSNEYHKGSVKVRVDPEDARFFPGETHPRTAVLGAKEVMALLTRVVRAEKIKVHARNEEEVSADMSHHIYFGGASYKKIAAVRGESGHNFEFLQEDAEWTIRDQEFDKTYSINNPRKLSREEFDAKTDFGIIEKFVDVAGRRTYFVFAGLGNRATHGCAWYFANCWETLLDRFGQADFKVVLKFPGNCQYYQGRVVDRKTGEIEADQE